MVTDDGSRAKRRLVNLAVDKTVARLGRLSRPWLRLGPCHDVESNTNPSALSVDLVYTQMIRSIDDQHDHAKGIDAKASFILTAASIIIGFHGLPGIGLGLQIRNPLWLAPAFVIYLLLLFAVFQAYRLRDFKSAGFDPAVLQEYLFDPTEFTKRQFTATMRLAYEENVPQIETKVSWLRRAEWFLIGEVFALLVGGIGGHEQVRISSWLHVIRLWVR